MNKNKFAIKPPMGWNSYDYYDTTVNEEEIKAHADYMAEHMKQYGWEYIVVDIEWFAHGAGSQREAYQYIPFNTLEIDEFGRLLPCPERFPSSVKGQGFKPLADYIHEKGLKFGIHIMRGIPRVAAYEHLPILGTNLTASDVANPSSICVWNPDMYGVRDMEGGQAYYDSIVELYSQWGVDFIKCDDIANTNAYPHNPYSGRHEIEMLYKAIQKAKRPIVLSLSPGPALIEEAWHYEKYANMWRITDDFWDDWELLKDMFHRCELWQNHVSPGCYPDCDMLPLGDLGEGFGHPRKSAFTLDEAKTMLSLWCIFRSPLMLGTNMLTMDQETLGLLTNQEVLNMLEPSCQSYQINRDDNQAVWASLNSKDSMLYIACFNLREKDSQLRINLQEVMETFDAYVDVDTCIAQLKKSQLRELWSKESINITSSMIETDVKKHGVKLFSVSI